MIRRCRFTGMVSILVAASVFLVNPSLHALPKDNKGSIHLKVYNAPGFYVFHTDVGLKTLRQIWLRMNFVAEAYQKRLHAIFGGAVTQKLPFYIFKNSHEYYADGGMPGSAGVFEYNYTGQWLMAIGGQHLTHQRWHIIQHEGFHQFTFAFIHRFLPAWANEGTAEFFGEGLFTGSSFVTGWIPPYREARIKYEIKHNKFKTIHAIREMSYRKWNDVLMGTNYDEAWSMIYFLAYANDGRYAVPFTQYLRLYREGLDAETAWDRIFGNDDLAFQRLYVKYWMNMPPNATAELYAGVQTEALTNFLARAYTLKQRFLSARSFLSAAKDGTLKVYHFPDRLWLPPNLLTHALRESRHIGAWSIQLSGLPKLICTMPDGTKIIGHFRIADNRPVGVNVTAVSSGKKAKSLSRLETVAR
ncbi:MAG: hypothetical protein ACP5I8_08865 [Phycisphaerae bacterium]